LDRRSDLHAGANEKDTLPAPAESQAREKLFSSAECNLNDETS